LVVHISAAPHTLPSEQENVTLLGSVEFEGTNVLEGMKQLAARGFVKGGKYPPTITNTIHTTNTMQIAER
jgi:hypothetical protein